MGATITTPVGPLNPPNPITTPVDVHTHPNVEGQSQPGGVGSRVESGVGVVSTVDHESTPIPSSSPVQISHSTSAPTGVVVDGKEKSALHINTGSGGAGVGGGDYSKSVASNGPSPMRNDPLHNSSWSFGK